MENTEKSLLSEAASVGQECCNTQLEPMKIMRSATGEGFVASKRSFTAKAPVPPASSDSSNLNLWVAAALPAFLDRLRQEKTTSKVAVNTSDQSEIFRTYSQ